MANTTVTIKPYFLEYDKKSVKTVLRQAGAEIAKIDRQLLSQKDGGGRKYGPHRASAPGSSATKITGQLAKSVKVRASRDGESVSIIESAFYAKFLEAGAKGGGRKKGGGYARNKRGKPPATSRVLEPRPSLPTALAQVEPELQARITAALNGSMAFKPGKAKKP